MKILLAYLLSPIHYLFFGLLLAVFHPIQMIAYNLFGPSAHKKSVDALNFFLVLNFYTLLSRASFYGTKNLPTGKPLIVISNHQSMFDAPPIVWSMRKHNLKFISKKSLGKWFPSISYNLRKSGAALIDRKDREQSLAEILKLGQRAEQNNYSVCIFPEGTRHKTGKLKSFKPGGIKTLLDAMPSAVVVPFVIRDNSKLHKKGYFPLCVGKHLRYYALEPIERAGLSNDEIIIKVEDSIKSILMNGRA